MKRKVALLTSLLCVVTHFSSCTKATTYSEYAYYANGFIITYSGQMHYAPEYMDALLNDSYVFVTFDDRGTTEVVDDKIINIMLGD